MYILSIIRSPVNLQRVAPNLYPTPPHTSSVQEGSFYHTLTYTVYGISARLFEDSQVFHEPSGHYQLPIPIEAKVGPYSLCLWLSTRDSWIWGSTKGVKLPGDGLEMLERPPTPDSCPLPYPFFKNCQMDKTPLLPEIEDRG